MRSILFLLIISASILASCGSKDNQVSTSEPETTIEPTQVPEPPENIPDVFSKEVLIVNDWKIQTVMDNGKVNSTQNWSGSVLDFEDNGTYTWKGGQINGTGTYEIDQEKSMLHLIATEGSSGEWTVKYRRGFMVWIGTSKYGQNSIQMSLVRGNVVDGE